MTWHVHLGSFEALLPGPPTDAYPTGEPFREAMRTGTMSVELFAPRGDDLQQPHDQDELYVVVAGTATFERDTERVAVAPGSVLFVPAAMAHRFTEISDDFATWVIFWGPSGGERGVELTSSFPMPVVAPAPLRTEQFVLEALAPRHNARDHAAWMANIDHIRATPGFRPADWGGDDWPFEMPLADNLRDLDQHANEFAGGKAFTYTVLESGSDDLIGCVYIDPDDTESSDARCRSWVRASHAELDRPLHIAVRDWLASPAWPFSSVRYPGRD